jgi:transposase
MRYHSDPPAPADIVRFMEQYPLREDCWTHKRDHLGSPHFKLIDGRKIGFTKMLLFAHGRLPEFDTKFFVSRRTCSTFHCSNVDHMVITLGQPEHVRETAREQYRYGRKVSEIAFDFGVPVSQVYNWVSAIETQAKRRSRIRSVTAATMSVMGYSVTEIADHLGISKQGVYDILSRAGDPETEDMSDEPEWHFAKARLRMAKSREEMSAIWSEYQSVWTEELTDYGKRILDGRARYGLDRQR